MPELDAELLEELLDDDEDELLEDELLEEELLVELLDEFVVPPEDVPPSLPQPTNKNAHPAIANMRMLNNRLVKYCLFIKAPRFCLLELSAAFAAALPSPNFC